MTAIGVTGHQRIPTEALKYVAEGIREFIDGQDRPITGYSSLAAGADQMFAQAVLETGGSLIGIIPCQGYEGTFDQDGLATYRSLRDQCASVVPPDFPEPAPEAFMAAGRQVMERSDLVVAVWDGQPAAGLGGTADAVAYARQLGKPVTIVWPKGVQR